jgi:beta-lactamase regulating signal transducer with metallopeptidase domain
MTYEFLIEMGWKSALIAGAALLLATMLRSRSAADRGAVLKLAVVLLLATPAIALLAPAFEIETAAPVAAAPVAESVAPASAEAVPIAALAPAAATLEPASDWNDPSLLFLLLYAGGLAMVGGRLGAGLWTLRRWTREAREVEAPEWRSALQRAGGDALGIRLLTSDDVSSPLSWGWRRPAILLDRDTLRMPGEADAILAHEVAHVARRDWPSLLASRLAVSLFWFNPLVWRLDREVAQQAEEAADSDAAAKVEPARYAQTLLDWARLSGSSAIPANAIAAGEPGLSKRVRAILDGRVGRPSGSAWTVAALVACAGFAGPVAALEFVEAAPEAPAAPRAPAKTPRPASAPLAPLPARAPAPLAAPAPVPPAPPAASVPLAPLPPIAPVQAAVEAQARANAAVRAAAHPGPRAPRRPYVDEEALEAEIEAAVERAMEGVEAATAAAERHAERAVEAALASVAHGAIGMEAGAKGMERGAEDMRREAARLRNRDYREAHIRKSRERGEHVTHEELLEAAKGLEEGSRGMLEGAREMREAAAEMRREARRR